jgi:hypothetical protein
MPNWVVLPGKDGHPSSVQPTQAGASVRAQGTHRQHRQGCGVFILERHRLQKPVLAFGSLTLPDYRIM